MNFYLKVVPQGSLENYMSFLPVSEPELLTKIHEN